MRKILPVLLIFALIPVMVVPASASEVDSNSGNWYDVLDNNYIWYPSNTSALGTNTGTIGANGSFFVSFGASVGQVYYIDSLMQFHGSAPTAITFKDYAGNVYPAQLKELSNGLYRVWCELDINQGGVSVQFTSSASVKVDVLSFKLLAVKAQFWKADGEFYFDNGYSAQSGYGTTSWTVPGDADYSGHEDQYWLTLWCNDWNLYDFLDFDLYIQNGSIDSISASNGYVSLPITTSILLQGPDTTYDQYETSDLSYPIPVGYSLIRVRVDLTGLNRSDKLNKHPELVITGDYYTGIGMNVSVQSYYAGIIYHEDDPLRGAIIDLQNALVGESADLESAIRNCLADLQGHLVYYMDLILAGGYNPPGPDVSQSLDDQSDEVDDLVGELEDVTKPAIDSIDVSLDGVVSQDDILMAASPLQALLSNQLVLWMTMISLTLGFVSYVLYGKR